MHRKGLTLGARCAALPSTLAKRLITCRTGLAEAAFSLDDSVEATLPHQLCEGGGKGFLFGPLAIEPPSAAGLLAWARVSTARFAVSHMVR